MIGADRNRVEALRQLPLVTHVAGRTTCDGRRICLQMIVDDSELTEIALSRDDVQPLVALLIALGGQAVSRSQGPDIPIEEVRSFPVSAMALTGCEDGDAVLVLQVGATSLGFSLDRERMDTLGRSLLTMSTRISDLPT